MLKSLHGDAHLDWQTFAEPHRVEVVEECRIELPEPPKPFHQVRVDFQGEVGDVLEQKIPKPRKKKKHGWNGSPRNLRRNTKFNPGSSSKWI